MPDQLGEVGICIDYFHDSSDEHLHVLGVDRELLPPREAWREFYDADYARPIRTFGDQAFMHLHILTAKDRGSGLGSPFVRKSAAIYFRALELQRLVSQPNALNVAPNRALQRAGFRYVLSEHTTPGPINFPQVVTRWELDRPT